MLLLIRKLTFYFFLILYFLVTPYVILYALGYNFSPTRVHLVKTGLVSIVTAPRSATVTIRGRKFSERTPTAVRDLLPGRYPVRIQRKGYEPWEKEIEILPEKATRLDPVILLPSRSETEEVSARRYQGLLPLSVDSKLIAWEGRTLDTLWKIDLFFNKETPIGRDIPEGPRMKIIEPAVKRGSNLVLFKVEKDGAQSFYALDLDREKEGPAGLGGMIKGPPDWISWEGKSPEDLYFLQNGTLPGSICGIRCFIPELRRTFSDSASGKTGFIF